MLLDTLPSPAARRPLAIRALLMAGLALGVVSCASTQPDSGDAPPPMLPASVEQNDNRAIKVGDQLELFVREDPAFNGTYRVRERGDIIIPDIGRIPLAGLDVTDAERKIERSLEKLQIKDATVILDRVRQQRPGSIVPDSQQILVYMTGAVIKPGQHLVTIPEGRPLGVYEAILISGGLARFADEQKIHLTRMDENRVRHRIPVNARLIRQGNKPDPAIGQGDVVVVPEKIFGF